MADASLVQSGEALGDPMLPLPYRVVERRQESRDTVTLALTSAGPTATAAFAPGQFSMLYAFGVGEIPISISGDPARRDRLVHTIRAVGAVSAALCAARPGTMLGLRGPFGSGWPLSLAGGKDLVFVAGGIGLAPLRPAIYQALAERARFGRVCVLVGARSEGDLLFADDFERWRAEGAEVLTTLDAASESWKGNVGVVTRLIPRAHLRPRQCVAMMCGPEIMMRFSIQALRDLGVGDGDIHLTMERNMKCAIGLCGHCQFGADFVCKDGPVLSLLRVAERLFIPEL